MFLLVGKRSGEGWADQRSGEGMGITVSVGSWVGGGVGSMSVSGMAVSGVSVSGVSVGSWVSGMAVSSVSVSGIGGLNDRGGWVVTGVVDGWCSCCEKVRICYNILTFTRISIK